MPRIALDADVLIYSVVDQPLGRRVRSILDSEGHQFCGSTLLLPETLIKPSRRASKELDALIEIFTAVDLWPATSVVCYLAVRLGARYGLKTIDAVHLATAVEGGADAFLTNNSKDFDQDAISEIDVLYPADLP